MHHVSHGSIPFDLIIMCYQSQVLKQDSVRAVSTSIGNTNVVLVALKVSNIIIMNRE